MALPLASQDWQRRNQVCPEGESTQVSPEVEFAPERGEDSDMNIITQNYHYCPGSHYSTTNSSKQAGVWVSIIYITELTGSILLR